jgi:PIN domain nuclease of toxin-antitoxin system
VTGRVLHTGALISLAEGSLYVASLLRVASDNDLILAVSATALAEAIAAIGDDRYRLDLAMTIDVVNVVPLTLSNAIEVGELCAKTNTSNLSAAHSAYLSVAHNWPVIAGAEDESALRAVRLDLVVDFVP